MNNKLIIAGAALAGVIGLAAVVRQSNPTAAGTPPAATPVASPLMQLQAPPPERPAMAPAAPAPRPVATRYVAPERTVTRSRPRTVTTTRSKKKSAVIIGGSAGAGAAIGALAGGGKGAGIGAIAGGVGGLIYDQATRKKTRVIE